jgi:hypothetical protein
LPFTYDLVFLGRLNHAPRWISVPVVTVVAGNLYSYAPTAVDADNDPLRFSVVSGPAGMAPLDYSLGPIVWATTTSNVGTYPIRLRVSDGQGGYADQTFVLAVITLPTGMQQGNTPPVFTSTPVVDANVNTAYTYQATATDIDGDTPLTFAADKQNARIDE